MTKIKLTKIKRDHELSPRVETRTSADTAEAYVACYDQLPPITIFKIEGEDLYLLTDGWHRYRAAEILKLDTVEADVKYGTREQAFEHALLSNLQHGLQLTRKEKRYVIEEFLKLHPQRSNSWIAKDLGASTTTVSKVREELEASSNLEECTVLYGQDGREYPRTIAQPKSGDDTGADQASEDDEAEADQAVEDDNATETFVPLPTLGIYELNKVHQVDCVEGLSELPEASIDLIFADPPYNIGIDYGSGSSDSLPTDKYFAWCMKWFMGVYRVLKPGGSFYVMHYPEVAARWMQQLAPVFTFRHWISWCYPSNVGHSKSNWTTAHRAILYLVKGSSAAYFEGEADPQPYRNPGDSRTDHTGKRGVTPYNWWEYNLVKNTSEDKVDWPNQLPVDLVKRIVVTSCPLDGIVCDPFMGSGTTAVAAALAERAWVGFDLEEKSLPTTEKRIKKIK